MSPVVNYSDCPPGLRVHYVPRSADAKSIENDLNSFTLGLIDLARSAVLDCRAETVTDLVSRLPASQLRRVVQALAILAGGLAARSPNRDWWTAPTPAGTGGVPSDGGR